MKVIKSDPSDLLEIIAKFHNKPCMYISFCYNIEGETDYIPEWGVIDWEEICKAAPYLKELKGNDEFTLRINAFAYILCDNEEELDQLYCQTVGDDGPTKQNPYKGNARVYALTCDAGGRLGTENT